MTHQTIRHLRLAFSLLCLSMICIGCTEADTTIIEQPAEAAQQMDDYEAMMDQAAKEPYGK